MIIQKLYIPTITAGSRCLYKAYDRNKLESPKIKTSCSRSIVGGDLGEDNYEY